MEHSNIYSGRTKIARVARRLAPNPWSRASGVQAASTLNYYNRSGFILVSPVNAQGQYGLVNGLTVNNPGRVSPQHGLAANQGDATQPKLSNADITLDGMLYPNDLSSTDVAVGFYPGGAHGGTDFLLAYAQYDPFTLLSLADPPAAPYGNTLVTSNPGGPLTNYNNMVSNYVEMYPQVNITYNVVCSPPPPQPPPPPTSPPPPNPPSVIPSGLLGSYSSRASCGTFGGAFRISTPGFPNNTIILNDGNPVFTFATVGLSTSTSVVPFPPYLYDGVSWQPLAYAVPSRLTPTSALGTNLENAAAGTAACYSYSLDLSGAGVWSGSATPAFAAVSLSLLNHTGQGQVTLYLSPDPTGNLYNLGPTVHPPPSPPLLRIHHAPTTSRSAAGSGNTRADRSLLDGISWGCGSQRHPHR